MTKLVKADLHVHIDGHSTKDNVIEYLKSAENSKVKKLCLLEHSYLNNLKPILEIMNDEGGIGKYYTGELIIGVEFVATIDRKHINKDGSCYDDNCTHILAYMPLKEAINLKSKSEKLFNRDTEKDYIDDYNIICNKIRSLDKNSICELPKCEDLKAISTPHIAKDLHKWITQGDEKRQNAYTKVLHLTDEQIKNPSTFIRELVLEKGSILYYQQKLYPPIKDLFEEVIKYAPSVRFVLAHPAHMSTAFNTQYYIDTIFSLPPMFKDRPNFYGIEVGYFLNTPDETEYLRKYATEHNLKMSAGSDSRYPLNEMFFTPNNSSTQYFYKPSFGTAFGTAFYDNKVEIETKSNKQYIKVINNGGELLVDEDFLSDFAIKEKQVEKTNSKKIITEYEK